MCLLYHANADMSRGLFFIFFRTDAKEWEGISGLVSEPCNSKVFGKLLKAFKKISNSLRSDSEIFLNNAASQIPRITMNPQMRPKSLPIPSLYTGGLTCIPFLTACRIVCLLPSSQETYIIESSKSPAVVAKSNKQWVGTCLYQDECKFLLINCGAVIRYRAA